MPTKPSLARGSLPKWAIFVPGRARPRLLCGPPTVCVPWRAPARGALTPSEGLITLLASRPSGEAGANLLALLSPNIRGQASAI